VVKPLDLEGLKTRLNTLKGNHKRTAVALFENVSALAAKFGIERLGFLTLTFADHVTSLKEAQRRFHSLRTGILAERYEHFVRVIERQKNGRIHYHLLVVLKCDIRTGFDFQAVNRGDYKSANQALRSEWAFWRKTAPLYRFGRTELMPVKSSAEGIARYVGKYISKHIGDRIEADKGARLVEYSGGARSWSSHFGWNTIEARLWREKCKALGNCLGVNDGEMHKHLGNRWAFKFQDEISRIIPEYWHQETVENLQALDSPPCLRLASDCTELWEQGRPMRITPQEAAAEIGHLINVGSFQKVRDIETGCAIENDQDEHRWQVGSKTTRKPEGFPVAHRFENGPHGARRRTDSAKGSPTGATLAPLPAVAVEQQELEI